MLEKFIKTYSGTYTRTAMVRHKGVVIAFAMDKGRRIWYTILELKEGIQLFNDHSDITLVITDIRMPKMDGNEVARHIRASYRANTPVVAITGGAFLKQ